MGFALQALRVVCYPAAVLDGQSSARPLWLRAVYLARAKCFQWSEAACEGAVFLSYLTVSFAIGLCTRVTLCCIHPSVSRETVGPMKQESSVKVWILLSQPWAVEFLTAVEVFYGR